MFKQESQSSIYSHNEISEIEKERTIAAAEFLKTGSNYNLNQKTNTQELILTNKQIEEIRTTVEDLFTRNIFTPQNIKEADKGELNPVALARFIEIEIDGNIHPFADGCGRTSKARSFSFSR